MFDSYQVEAQYVELYDNGTTDDTSDDKYYIAVKSAKNFRTSNSEEYWSIYLANTDGTFDSTNFVNISIRDFEDKFGQDIDGDQSIGVDVNSIQTVSSDTSSTGGYLESGSGALFINDGTQRIQIKDVNGSSKYSDTGYAVEIQADGTYLLAVNSSDENSNNWQFVTLSSQGVISSDEIIYTKEVEDFEVLLNQDLDDDTYIGLNLSSLQSIDTDTTGYQLQSNNEGSIYIWDGISNSSILSVEDDSGIAPIYQYTSDGLTTAAYAVYRDENDNDDIHYKVAIKRNETINSVTSTSWNILKVSELGIIDYQNSFTTDSITTFEDEFGQDMNGDGDFSGEIATDNRDTDTTVSGAVLAEESVGNSLYIIDGSSKIKINASNIERDASNYQSIAIAVSDINNNGTSNDSSDDYYRLAVKETSNIITYDNQTEDSENWIIYSIDSDGELISEQTIKTNSIQPFELEFAQDLNGDNFTGINISNLSASSWITNSQTITDTGDWKLLKGENSSLFIINALDEENSLITLSTDTGELLDFERTFNDGDDVINSESIAIEDKENGLYNLLVRESGENSDTEYIIYEVSSAGVISISDSLTTKEINVYEEEMFGQDIEGDGLGFDSSSLSQVNTDTTDVLLFENTTDNEFFIKEGDDYIPITDDSGDPAELETSSTSSSGYSVKTLIAVEGENGIDLNSDGDANGYTLAIKISGQYNGESLSSWELLYTDSKGVLDNDFIIKTNSITYKEEEFGQDLNGDNVIGLNTNTLSSILTDDFGDLLEKDSAGTYYIIDDNDTTDNADDFRVTFNYSDGKSPNFENSYQSGAGEDLTTNTSIPFAVESFTDSGEKKYLLIIKKEKLDSYDNLTTSSFDTYKISLDAEDVTKGIIDPNNKELGSLGPTESYLNKDLDGDGFVWSVNTVSTQM